jgi:hypothetical protein
MAAVVEDEEQAAEDEEADAMDFSMM